MRGFGLTAYRRLAQAVSVPLLVAETSVGAHVKAADVIAAGCATVVRTGRRYKGRVTAALRIAHRADAFRPRSGVHGGCKLR